jgi:hypothetical protein
MAKKSHLPSAQNLLFKIQNSVTTKTPLPARHGQGREDYAIKRYLLISLVSRVSVGTAFNSLSPALKFPEHPLSSTQAPAAFSPPGRIINNS